MADAPTEQPEPAPVPEPDKASETELVGVWVLLAVIVLPAVQTGLAQHLAPYWRLSYRDAVFCVTNAIASTALVAFIAWKAAIPRSQLGLVRPRWVPDVALAALLVGLTYVIYQFVEQVVGPSTYDDGRGSDPRHFGRPIGTLSWLATIARVLAIGFGEELAFRGFLVPSLARVLNSRGWAVVVSAAVFGSMHLYQGAVGFMGSTLFGALMAVTFLAVGRLWPSVLAHSAYDLWVGLEWDLREYSEIELAKPGTGGRVDW